MVWAHWTGLDLSLALANYLDRFTHLLYPHPVSREVVTRRVQGTLKFNPIVVVIRRTVTKVPVNASGPQHRTGYGSIDHLLRRELRDPFRTREDYLVTCQQVFHIIDSVRQFSEKCVHGRPELFGGIHEDTSGS